LIWFNGGHFEIIHRFTTDYASLAAALAKTHFPADSNYVIPSIPQPGSVCRVQNHKFAEGTSGSGAPDAAAGGRGECKSDRGQPECHRRRFRVDSGSEDFALGDARFQAAPSRTSLSDGATLANSGRENPREPWQIAFRDLANANIAVYPIDARGLVAPRDIADKSDVDPLPRSQGERIAAQVKVNLEYVTGLKWVAAETGGIAFTNSNAFEDALFRASANSAGTYMLSFRLPANVKPGWHPIASSRREKTFT